MRSSESGWEKATLWILLVLDIAAVLAAYRLAFYLRSLTTFFGLFQEPMPLTRFGQVPTFSWLMVLSQILLFYLFGLYDRLRHLSRHQILRLVVQAVVLHNLVMTSFYFFAAKDFPRSVFPIFGAISLLVVVSLRLALVSWFFGARARRKVLIVGTTDSARNLLKEIQRLPSLGLEVAGIIDGEGNADGTFEGFPILGRREDIVSVAQQEEVDEIILASGSSWQEKLIDDISRSEMATARVSLIPSCYEILIGKVKHLKIYDIPLIEALREPTGLYPRALKSVLDRGFAALCLILLSPLFIAVALLVLLTTRGPIFYRQERLGEGGKPFSIIKFRTMIPEAERHTGPVLATENDRRVTPVGRFLRRTRLDEVPQLINIVRGDMSFVGPRPERPFFVGEFVRSIPGYNGRFRAKPGLTGLAQVNGGYDTTTENKLKYDLAYIYNQSPFLDLMILVETIKVIVTGKVAH